MPIAQYLLSCSIICEVITEVRDKVVPLYAVSEGIAELDLIVSLTHATSLGTQQFF